MDPLELLPPELWRVIFDKVDDPQNWLNLYRASPSSFEAVVGDELPNALFPKVFSLMHEYLHPTRTIDNVLHLRLVSRKCKEIVDKAFTVNPLQFKMRAYYTFGGWLPTPNESERISRFLEKFDNHPGNPLIGNVVLVNIIEDMDDLEEYTEFKRLVERFMGRFGVHIRELSLDYTKRGGGGGDGDNTLDDFVILLGTCLNASPKLEELTVDFNGRLSVDYRLEDPSLVGNQPLPLISSLTYFSFGFLGTWRSSLTLQSIVVRMCCHPDTLTRAVLVGVPAELASFPNLEIVNLDCKCDSDDEDDDETNAEDVISLLPSTSWPLSQLTLGLPDSAVPLDHLLNCVEHFKDTLTSLEVSSWKASPQDALLRVNLPRLKYLEVEETDVPLALLTNLEELEELRVGSHQEFVSREQVIERVEAMKREMWEFDVWNSLPKLEEIQFSAHFWPQREDGGESFGGHFVRWLRDNYDEEVMRTFLINL